MPPAAPSIPAHVQHALPTVVKLHENRLAETKKTVHKKLEALVTACHDDNQQRVELTGKEAGLKEKSQILAGVRRELSKAKKESLNKLIELGEGEVRRLTDKIKEKQNLLEQATQQREKGIQTLARARNEARESLLKLDEILGARAELIGNQAIQRSTTSNSTSIQKANAEYFRNRGGSRIPEPQIMHSLQFVFETQLNVLYRVLTHCRNIIVLAGAGISVSAGSSYPDPISSSMSNPI